MEKVVRLIMFEHLIRSSDYFRVEIWSNGFANSIHIKKIEDNCIYYRIKMFVSYFVILIFDNFINGYYIKQLLQF